MIKIVAAHARVRAHLKTLLVIVIHTPLYLHVCGCGDQAHADQFLLVAALLCFTFKGIFLLFGHFKTRSSGRMTGWMYGSEGDSGETTICIYEPSGGITFSSSASLLLGVACSEDLFVE